MGRILVEYSDSYILSCQNECEKLCHKCIGVSEWCHHRSEINCDPSPTYFSGSSNSFDAFGTLDELPGINLKISEVTSSSNADFCATVGKHLQSMCWKALISNIWGQFLKDKLHVAIVFIVVLRIVICFCMRNSLYQNSSDRIMLKLVAYTWACCNCENSGPKLGIHSIE